MYYICIINKFKGHMNKTKPTTFTIPTDLRDWIKKESLKDGRSMSNYVVKILESVRVQMVNRVNDDML